MKMKKDSNEVHGKNAVASCVIWAVDGCGSVWFVEMKTKPCMHFFLNFDRAAYAARSKFKRMEEVEILKRELETLKERIVRSNLTLCDGCDCYFGYTTKFRQCGAQNCHRNFCQACIAQHLVDIRLGDFLLAVICKHCVPSGNRK